MKRIFALIVSATLVISCFSFAVAEDGSSHDSKWIWETAYQMMEQIGDKPTMEQFTEIATYCIVAQFGHIQNVIDNNKKMFEASAPAFASMDSEQATEMMKNLVEMNRGLVENEHKLYYAQLNYCNKCYESGEFTWGALKTLAYGGAYFGTDEYDEEKAESMPKVDTLN